MPSSKNVRPISVGFRDGVKRAASLAASLMATPDWIQVEVVTMWRVWFLAARPKTLLASICPVAIGTALAQRDGAFMPWPPPPRYSAPSRFRLAPISATTILIFARVPIRYNAKVRREPFRRAGSRPRRCCGHSGGVHVDGHRLRLSRGPRRLATRGCRGGQHPVRNRVHRLTILVGVPGTRGSLCARLFRTGGRGWYPFRTGPQLLRAPASPGSHPD